MENCLIFRISQFSWVDLHSNILKLWENGEEFWNKVFCMLSPGAFVRWCMKPAALNYTLRNKKCNLPTFLRGDFSLFYRCSNFCVLQENHEEFWNRFFAHCHQEHWQNEIHYKVHLSTLFPKRNATFHAAFLLKKSVHTKKWTFRRKHPFHTFYEIGRFNIGRFNIFVCTHFHMALPSQIPLSTHKFGRSGYSTFS